MRILQDFKRLLKNRFSIKSRHSREGGNPVFSNVPDSPVKPGNNRIRFFQQPAERISAVIPVLSMLFIICSCGQKAAPDKPKVVPVSAASAAQKDVPVQLSAIGNVEAYSTVSINSRIAGQLLRVHFREGQDVNKGDLLFTIDPRPFEAALRQAEANLARDTAQMENARQNAGRYADLEKKGYVARADYDQIRTNADALEAVVQADKAIVENARLQLSYCSVYSPIAGRTGNLQINQGNLIKENDKTILTINQVTPIYVSFSLPEQYLPEIKKHMSAGRLKVEAVIPQNSGRFLHGELTFIDNAVDRTTGTIRLKGTFDNKDKHLWPGQFVNVILKLSVQMNAIAVPSEAVVTGQQGQIVFVIKPDMTAEPRTVTASRTFGNETIIEKGIAPGEKVVTDGQLRLVPGVKVEIKNSLDSGKPVSGGKESR